MLILMFLPLIVSAHKKQSPTLRVDPPNWWIGMNNTQLELLIHGENIQKYQITLAGKETIITSITQPPNKNYVYVTLDIGVQQMPGNLVFSFSLDHKKKFDYLYSMLPRESQTHARGIDASDLIYLVFPDRFANGDKSNDFFPALKENTCDRTGMKTRHGGDLAGIENHLDYLEELGTTALWINPVLENNQPAESYHGYAATDLYRIDPRFGTNKKYKELVEACHSRDMQVIWDVVYNHWGNENYLFKEIPDSNWIHWFPEFTRTSYRAEVLIDPYSSDYDRIRMSNAWFDKHMPDLNQQDPHLASYLIQNSIWWIEYAGIDAFRIDTYAYPDQDFMQKLDERIRYEYPDFVLFGETWVQGAPVQGWFTENCFLKKDFSSSLQGVTDFQLYYAITKGLKEPFGWEEGLRRIQMTLANDIVYQDPFMLVTFLDNHDLSRFYSMIDEDINKYRMGISMLYTLRGIPSIYYGTEILMKNYADPDGKVREDFPGGWPEDTSNKFLPSGRSEKETQAFDLCKTLGQWRRKNGWIGRSQLTQFVPESNTYVYFRHDGEHKILCVYNLNDSEFSLDLDRFKELSIENKNVTDLISGNRFILSEKMNLPAKSVMVLEFQ